LDAAVVETQADGAEPEVSAAPGACATAAATAVATVGSKTLGTM
jgi:hypothetical protein